MAINTEKLKYFLKVQEKEDLNVDFWLVNKIMCEHFIYFQCLKKVQAASQLCPLWPGPHRTVIFKAEDFSHLAHLLCLFMSPVNRVVIRSDIKDLNNLNAQSTI